MDHYKFKLPALHAIHEAIRKFFPVDPLPKNAIELTDILLAIEDAQTLDTLNGISNELKEHYANGKFDDAGRAKIRELGEKRKQKLTA